MRVLTFNLWHGLSPSSPVAFEALEPTGRRALRQEQQVRLLRELKPDICFFQEVNPIGARASELGDALRMDTAFQPDLVGLKLFGVGLPLNLNSGLLTLADHSYGLRKLAGVSLSRPGTHLVHSWGSWQLKEERFALFAETMLPNWGRVLLINTHLHHGLEATPEFLADLEKLADEMDLSPAVVSEIHRRLEKGSERRAQELGVLIENLHKFERRAEVVLIGGDFNASPDSEFGGALRDLGFRDTWKEAHATEPGFSFDKTRNPANHLLQAHFPLTLVVEDLSFSTKTKEALLALARKQESRPRRIDYVWMRSDSVELKIKKVDLVGLPDEEGLAPSDHFGVCADIERV
jgi:endonuclease/exonuclease/phosphatase family metal-dependent hydrolase